MGALIHIENMKKIYNPGENEVRALDGIDLDIEKGDLVAIVGHSGSGKSTLMNMLGCLDTPTSGKYVLDGQDVASMTDNQLADVRNKEIGFIFQRFNLISNLDAVGNVELPLVYRGVSKNERKQLAMEALKSVGLEDRMKHKPNEMSGGQQQRAALARAIDTEPKVLLLDEPLSAIDALLRKSLQMEIRRIQRETDITAIFVTHDQNEAMVMSDMIHLLYDGKIEQSAEPAQMYARPATKFAASFIGSYNIISSEEFQKMTGTKAESETIAFRPESVKLSEERPDETDSYVFRGKIVDGIPQGNVYRYGIGCEGVRIHADVLFQETGLLRDFTECWLSIRKEDCILL